VQMIDLYLVFRFVKGRCLGSQLILVKCHECRLIPLAFFAVSLENELQYHCLNVRINSGDDVTTLSLMAAGDTSLASASSSLTCPSCQSKFEVMSSLVAHVTLTHGRRGTVHRRAGAVRSKRPFRCYRCWKTFTVLSKLQRHMLSHAENLKNFKCDVCINVAIILCKSL